MNTLVSPELQELIAVRSEKYGPPQDSFERLAAIWSNLLSAHYGKRAVIVWDKDPLPVHCVCAMVAAWKLLRLSSGYTDDSCADAVAFVEFAYQSQPQRKEMNQQQYDATPKVQDG